MIADATLDMRRPTLFVFAAPHLHRFRIALDPPVPGVEMQFPADFPCDIGELQHGNRNIADSNRRVEFLAFADSRDEVGEVSVGHGIAAEEIGG